MSDPIVTKYRYAALFLAVLAISCARPVAEEKREGLSSEKMKIQGVLRPHPRNPRYFSDPSGKVIYLTGSHNWGNIHDVSRKGEAVYPDFNSHLDVLERHGHNFLRLWSLESPVGFSEEGEVLSVSPLPFERTGPGAARDGLPKFDGSRLNHEYFARLRDRVKTAGERGVYVSVMLFQGIVGVNRKGEWSYHPFHRDNNVNGIDGDPDGDGLGKETHTLTLPMVNDYQEAYVRRVVDSVNEFDNVLFEIGNEMYGGSTEFQYRMIRLIREHESGKPKQHPVGMTFQFDRTEPGTNEGLYKGPADWVSPGEETGRSFKDDPPAWKGEKVAILDTDHLWGVGGDRAWVWKSFTRGYNPIYMDPLGSEGAHIEVRQAMGHTLRYATRLDLENATPRGDLCSTGYCLAEPGERYLIYLPDSGSVKDFLVKPAITVMLSAGRYDYEWFDPASGRTVVGSPFAVDEGDRSFRSPFRGDAVLYIHRR